MTRLILSTAITNQVFELELSAEGGLISELNHSHIYKDCRRAFTETTGLNLIYRSAKNAGKIPQKYRLGNPFCVLMGKHISTCDSCLKGNDIFIPPGLRYRGRNICFAGLCRIVAPLKAGDKLMGYLEADRVRCACVAKELPFKNVAEKLRGWNVGVEFRKAGKVHSKIPFFISREYQAVARLLKIFARHLSLLNDQLILGQGHSEHPLIRRAKAFISEHQNEKLALAEVAKAVHVSTYYFCKIFKTMTGLHFTDYLSRLRVEKAKILLLNPHLRVSEVAFKVGFQSVAHFNRMFRKLVGLSPTKFRSKPFSLPSLKNGNDNSRVQRLSNGF